MNRGIPCEKIRSSVRIWVVCGSSFGAQERRGNPPGNIQKNESRGEKEDLKDEKFTKEV